LQGSVISEEFKNSKPETENSELETGNRKPVYFMTATPCS